MAISFQTSPFAHYVNNPNYENLVECIQIFLNRHDQDTLNAIPLFINFAEKTALRQLRMPRTTVTKKFTLTVAGNYDEGYINVPRDYIEMQNFWYEGEHATSLLRVDFEQLIDRDNIDPKFPLPMYGECDVYSSGGDNPQYWAINGQRLYIRPIPPKIKVTHEDGSVTEEDTLEFKLTYYADLPELSPFVNKKNALLELCPDVILYFAVAEGLRFLIEPERGAQYEQFANQRLAQIISQYENEKYYKSMQLNTRG